MPNSSKGLLHLKASSEDDLAIISGAVQDAIMRVDGIIYDAKGRSLTLAMQRFRHEDETPSRILSGLRIDTVLSMKSRGINRSQKEAFLVLLSVTLEEKGKSNFEISLNFAGNGQILMEVEYIDVLMADKGDAWFTKSVPNHKTDA